MTWVAAFLICIFSIFAIVSPCAANNCMICNQVRAQKPVQPQAKSRQLGDFGSIDDWLLKRVRSSGKAVTA